jgi:hypothetical protein
VAVGGALLLGATAGLVLDRSPDPDPARAEPVAAGGLSMTLPPGWHRVDRGGEVIAARTVSGSSVQARLVERPLQPKAGADPVQLGTLQVWRRAAPGGVVYATSTSAGTLVVTCRASLSNEPGGLRTCERAASTLRLRDASAPPLTAAFDESKRIRAAVAALSAEREGARARLGRASTPRGQRLSAQDLAGIHRRAAAALAGLKGAESIEAAVRGASAAYSSLAASAAGGSARRWDDATELVRRSETALAKAIAAAD